MPNDDRSPRPLPALLDDLRGLAADVQVVLHRAPEAHCAAERADFQVCFALKALPLGADQDLSALVLAFAEVEAHAAAVGQAAARIRETLSRLPLRFAVSE